MKVAIYRVLDGKIMHRITSSNATNIPNQCQQGEEFYLNCPYGATHIIGNEPVTINLPPTAAELLSEIRRQRDSLLRGCDWTMLEDAVVDKTAWKKYRKDLRDFPALCDPVNPVWPVQPA